MTYSQVVFILSIAINRAKRVTNSNYTERGIFANDEKKQ